jgi:hypothetical protein
VAREGLLHRWYSGQKGALLQGVQWPGRVSSTGGTVARKGLFHQWYSGQEGTPPPVVEWPERGSSIGGTVARKGLSHEGLFHRWYISQKRLLHRWYSGQEGARPPVVQWPGTETDDPPTGSTDVKNAWSCSNSSYMRCHAVLFHDAQ